MNKRPLIEKLLDNWKVKVICLIVAIFLYVFHQGSLIEKKTFVVPLTITENGIVMHVGTVPNSVSVIVRTSANDINSIASTDITASVNLDTITQKGVYEVPVSVNISDKLKAFDTFELLVKEQNVVIHVDKKASKYVSLEPYSVGEVAHGYNISDIQMNPSSILISGPESVLNSMDSIQTTKINVSNAEKTFSTEVYSLQNATTYKIVEEGPYRATVVVDPIDDQKEFSDVVIEVLNLKDNLEIQNEIPFITVKLAGYMPVLEAYTMSKHFVQADFNEISEPGDYTIKLKYNVPRNLEISEAPFQEIKVTVVEKMTEAEEIQTDSSNDSETNIGTEKPAVAEG